MGVLEILNWNTGDPILGTQGILSWETIEILSLQPQRSYKENSKDPIMGSQEIQSCKRSLEILSCKRTSGDPIMGINPLISYHVYEPREILSWE